MRYKLIKKYPHSPELGTIVTSYVENNFTMYYEWEEFSFDPAEIENYPEFWQPESEWIVMSKRINSELGSLHWLNTLLGNVAHMGEYLKNYGQEQKIRHYGELIEGDVREVMDYFQDKLK